MNNNKKDKVTSQNQKHLSFEGRPGSRGTDTPFKWGRIFGNHVSNKGLVPIIFFKNVDNSITKTKQLDLNMTLNSSLGKCLYRGIEYTFLQRRKTDD